MSKIYKVEDTELTAVANLIKQMRGTSQATLYKWPGDFKSNLTTLKGLIDQILSEFDANVLNSTVISQITSAQSRIESLTQQLAEATGSEAVDTIVEYLYILRLLSATPEEQEEFIQDSEYESINEIREEYEDLIDEADEAELNGDELTPLQEAILICADLLEKLGNKDYQEVIVTSTLSGAQIRTGIEEIEARYRQNYTAEELEENSFVLYATKARFNSNASFLSCGVVNGEIIDSMYYYRSFYEPNFFATKGNPPPEVVINAGANLLRIVLKEIAPDVEEV